jgi:hypothetical protein
MLGQVVDDDGRSGDHQGFGYASADAGGCPGD